MNDGWKQLPYQAYSVVHEKLHCFSSEEKQVKGTVIVEIRLSSITARMWNVHKG